MEEKNHFQDIVVNLTRLTAKDRLNWHRSTEEGRGDAEWDMYEAHHNGRTFVLRSAAAYLNTSGERAGRAGFASLVANPQNYILEAVTRNKRIFFPQMRAINNLAKLVVSYGDNDLTEINEDLERAVNQLGENAAS